MIAILIIVAWTILAGVYLGIYKTLFGSLINSCDEPHVSVFFGVIFAPIAMLVMIAYLMGIAINKYMERNFKQFISK